MKIELDIEELVLHGFTPQEGSAIAEALHNELARLLAQPDADDLFSEDTRLPRLDGGSFDLSGSAGGAAVGAGIGRAVLAGLSSRQTDPSAGTAGAEARQTHQRKNEADDHDRAGVELKWTVS